MIEDEVERHCVAIFGEPSRRGEFQIDGHVIRIFKWEAAASLLGVDLYLSAGAARDRMHATTPGHRNEFFVGLSPEQDNVGRALAMVALDHALHGSALGHGQSVTYPEPLWPGTVMRTFLVTSPRSTVIPTLALDDGLHIEFLQLIPLYPDELAYKAAHGTDALLAEFEREGVQFWDPDRPRSTAATT